MTDERKDGQPKNLPKVVPSDRWDQPQEEQRARRREQERMREWEEQREREERMEEKRMEAARLAEEELKRKCEADFRAVQPQKIAEFCRDVESLWRDVRRRDPSLRRARLIFKDTCDDLDNYMYVAGKTIYCDLPGILRRRHPPELARDGLLHECAHIMFNAEAHRNGVRLYWGSLPDAEASGKAAQLLRTIYDHYYMVNEFGAEAVAHQAFEPQFGYATVGGRADCIDRFCEDAWGCAVNVANLVVHPAFGSRHRLRTEETIIRAQLAFRKWLDLHRPLEGWKLSVDAIKRFVELPRGKELVEGVYVFNHGAAALDEARQSKPKKRKL